MKKLLNWLDDHILLLLSGFLIAFIPLYPKIPLFSPIESYIVRVRLEDVFVFFSVAVLALQIWRQKIIFKRNLAVTLIGLYAFAGLLSVISAVLITRTVPLEAIHLGKTLLHYFRYLEYFTLFFIVASAVKSLRDIKVILAVTVITLVGITIYGYGQKYYYWPVYSTMNREFSKGIRLYLTEHARVQSTFGGHYDLAAYLVIALPLILSLSYFTKPRKLSAFLYGTFVGGSWLLILSASRTSFAAYLLGVFLVTALSAWFQPTWYQRIKWGLSRGVILVTVILILMANFGTDMYERLLQVLEGYPSAYQTYQMFDTQRQAFVKDSALAFKDLGLRLPSLMPEAEKPENGVGFDNSGEGIALVPSDERPVTERPDRPSDVYVDVPEPIQIATISATGEKIIITTERQRVFSECALQRGLSLCIRLETLWPKAIAGFMRNPLFGSGYATLNKDTLSQFTEAESTDNNFLRTLGETGLFGFITFYGAVIVIMWYGYLHLTRGTELGYALGIGILGATLGLLVNAIYIDVFAASKVAFTYWALAGLLVASYEITQPPVATVTTVSKKRKRKAQ